MEPITSSNTNHPKLLLVSSCLSALSVEENVEAAPTQLCLHNTTADKQASNPQGTWPECDLAVRLPATLVVGCQIRAKDWLILASLEPNGANHKQQHKSSQTSAGFLLPFCTSQLCLHNTTADKQASNPQGTWPECDLAVRLPATLVVGCQIRAEDWLILASLEPNGANHK